MLFLTFSSVVVYVCCDTDAWACFPYPVVNLTLIDLPGLTKIAVGIFSLPFLFVFGFICWHEIHLILNADFLCRGTIWKYCRRHWKHGAALRWEGNVNFSFTFVTDLWQVLLVLFSMCVCMCMLILSKMKLILLCISHMKP